MFVANRRDFLKAAALPLMAAHGAVPLKKNCIFLMLVGGPSQLDTWDPKPDAPSSVRSHYAPLKTNVADIEISSLFPRMAGVADKYALIRGCYHDGEPVHDIGHQLMQTGRVGEQHPHVGCVFSSVSGGRHVLLPAPIGKTGGNMPHGQSAGCLGSEHEPRVISGSTSFAQSCHQAVDLIASGDARFVTVNMFETVFNKTTWDMHGSSPFSPMSAYRDYVAPMFDNAYSGLLQDLERRGLLADTLVVATGEFGRTPRINPAGGRDHWTGCWTMLMAGGGVRGGQVIGASDAIAAEPRERPVSPQEVQATIYHSLDIDHTPWTDPGTRPVMELFG